MLNWLFGPRRRDGIPDDLYGAIVAQARSRTLYADFGVPDTVAGRFEMVVLHTALVLRRLEAGTETERALGDAVFRRFCVDMDESMREFGVNDAVMGKRMKKMAQGYFGRATAYGAAAAERSTDDMRSVLARNLFPAGDTAADLRLAAYAIRLWDAYEALPEGALEVGAPALPTVEVST